MENSAIEASLSTHALTFRSPEQPVAFEVSVGNNSDRFANFHVEVSAPGENLSSGYKWYKISPEVAAAQPHGSTTTFQVIIFESPVPGFVGTIDLTVRVFSPQLREERRLVVRLTIESDRRPSLISIELPARQFQIYPRNPIDIPVRVRNLGQQFVEVILKFTGIDSAWMVGGAERRVSLAPASQAEVNFQCQPPAVTKSPSKDYPFKIEAVGFDLPAGSNTGNIEILPVGFFGFTIDPKQIQLPAQGRWLPNWKEKTTSLAAAVKNDSNLYQQVDLLIQGRDLDRCEPILPPTANLNLGQTTTLPVEIATKRPWVGIGKTLHLEAKPVLSDQRLGTTDPATESFTIKVLPIVPLWLQLLALGAIGGLIALLLKPGTIAHTEFVNSVRFSGDGDTVISGSDDCTIRRWQRDSKKLVPARSLVATQVTACGKAQPPQGLLATPNRAVSVVRLMPEDSNRLAAGLENGNVELWNVTTAKKTAELVAPQQKTDDRVFDLVFSQDSNYLFVGHGSGTVQMWQRSAADRQFQLSAEHSIDLKSQLKVGFQVRSLALSGDRNILAIGGNYKQFVVWQGQERNFEGKSSNLGIQKLAKLDEKLSAGSGDFIWGLAFVPNTPSILATADSDGYITIWDLASCAQSGTAVAEGVKELNCHSTGVKARWQASKQAIRSIAFSEDGKLLVSGGDDGKLMGWWLTPKYELDRVKSPIGQEIYRGDRKINSIDLKTIDRGVAIITGGEDFQVKLHQLMN
jgi:WD40 repeat protein